MARLIVVSSPALADGFRLAGPATYEAHPGPDGEAAVRAAVAGSAVGLVLVTEDVWAGLPDRLQGDLERLARPVVLAIPAGFITDVTTRRQLLGEMLERAIGYRIELTGAMGAADAHRSGAETQP